MDDDEVLLKAVSNGGDIYVVKCDGYEKNERLMINNTAKYDKNEPVMRGTSARRSALLWHNRFGHMMPCMGAHRRSEKISCKRH